MSEKKGMRRKDSNLTNLCWNASDKSDVKHTHGCIIMRGGKIIARGRNHYHNRYWPTLHAEVHALLQVIKQGIDPRQIRLYVSRFDGKGAPLYSKPCPNCQISLEAMNVKKVFYMDGDQTWAKLEAPKAN